MGRRITGRFLATDEFNLDGHHIQGMTFLEDFPRGGASVGQVMAWNGDQWAPQSFSGTSILSVTWGDVTDKPEEYPPEAHTQDWDTITGKPTFVHSVTAGTGIEVSDVSGTLVEITCDLTWSELGDKPTFVNDISAGDGIAVSAATGSVTISDSYHLDTDEPTGFVNTTSSAYSINNNRTFSVEPAATSFEYYDQGVKYTKSATESVTFADTEGIKIFYYQGDTLSQTTVFAPEELIGQAALVAIARWDATNNTVIYIGEERHGVTMDGKTHRYLHLTEGTRYISGQALGDITADGDGSLNSHATLSVAAGTVADEDLFLYIAGTVGATQTWETYFKTDTGDWRREDTGDYPFRSTGNNTPTYNEVSGSTWSQTNVTLNRYFLCHIFRTNSLTAAFINVQGENEYISIAAARAGATTELGLLFTAGMPFAEFVPLGTGILQFGPYSNTPNTRFRSTDTGEDYVDWRTSDLPVGAGPSDHGSLSGLAHPDHPLTALQQSSATTGQVVEWNGATWVPADLKFNANVFFDGGGTYVTSNTQALLRMPAGGVLDEVSVFADKVDTCTFSVEAATYGDYATYTDVTGGIDLTLSAAKKSSKTSLGTWSTTFAEGDIVRVTVDTTNTTQTQLLVVLDFVRGG